MTTNSQLSATEPKIKMKTKTNPANNYNRNRIKEMEITRRIISDKGKVGE